jgi:hypothetical protein
VRLRWSSVPGLLVKRNRYGQVRRPQVRTLRAQLVFGMLRPGDRAVLGQHGREPLWARRRQVLGMFTRRLPFGQVVHCFLCDREGRMRGVLRERYVLPRYAGRALRSSGGFVQELFRRDAPLLHGRLQHLSVQRLLQHSAAEMHARLRGPVVRWSCQPGGLRGLHGRGHAVREQRGDVHLPVA